MERPSLLERYQLESELGHGGAGEVHLAHDRRIGRRVALKFIRSESAGEKAIARFIREIHLQARLEHPSIVPVYDLLTDDAGRTCLSMRHVRGVTLEDVLSALRRSDPETRRRFSSHKLLSGFVAICLAVDFAHRQGVVHRDIKPSNIMLGDFGETYLLDWGIAKITGAEEVELDPEPPSATPPLLTRAGARLGTPGFMPPEQVRGDLAALGPPADVYALGAILFEVITLEPLHPRTSLFELVESTLVGTEAHIASRGLELLIAPELVQICGRATELEPRDRYANAGELASAVEAFLDGTRDAELRKRASVLEAARGGEEAGRAKEGPEGGHPARSAALRHLTRALSLDPSNSAARDALGTLLLDLPAELPPEARAEVEALGLRYERVGAQRGAMILIAGLAVCLLLLALPIRSATLVGAFIGLVLSMGVVAKIGPLQSPALRVARRRLNLGLGLALLVVGGSLFGPLVAMPAIACAMLIPFVANEPSRLRPWIVSGFAGAIAIPTVAEALGWLPAAYAFGGGALSILPRALELSEPGLVLPYLLLISLVPIVGSGFLVSGLVSRSREATERLQLQAWYLRQLIPELADAMQRSQAGDGARRFDGPSD